MKKMCLVTSLLWLPINALSSHNENNGFSALVSLVNEGEGSYQAVCLDGVENITESDLKKGNFCPHRVFERDTDLIVPGGDITFQTRNTSSSTSDRYVIADESWFKDALVSFSFSFKNNETAFYRKEYQEVKVTDSRGKSVSWKSSQSKYSGSHEFKNLVTPVTIRINTDSSNYSSYYTLSLQKVSYKIRDTNSIIMSSNNQHRYETLHTLGETSPGYQLEFFASVQLFDNYESIECGQIKFSSNSGDIFLNYNNPSQMIKLETPIKVKVYSACFTSRKEDVENEELDLTLELSDFKPNEP